MPKVTPRSAAAQNLDRHGLLLVGHQRDLRHPGQHPGHLTDHPDVVDHGLAGLAPRAAKPLSTTTRRVNGSRGAYTICAPMASRATRSRRPSSSRRCWFSVASACWSCSAAASARLCRLSCSLSRSSWAWVTKNSPTRSHERARQGRQALQRVDDHRHRLLQGLQIAEARIGHQQSDGQQGEERETGEEARTALEERRRGVFHCLRLSGARRRPARGRSG